jgi:hypothetical protein
MNNTEVLNTKKEAHEPDHEIDLDDDDYLDDEPQRKPKGKNLRKFRDIKE